MWTHSFFGILPNGAVSEGGGKGFTWRAATRLFGEGAKLRYATAIGDIQPEIYKKYKLPKRCPVCVGQYTDWRLPTAHELKTLIHARDRI